MSYTPTLDELRRAFERRAGEVAAALEIKATIVAVEQDHPSGSGTVTTVKVVGERNKYWIRLYGGDDNDLYEAWNISGVKPKDGMPVICQLTDGDYEILRQRPKEADELYADAAPALSGTDDSGELSNTVWPGRNFLPGLVRMVNDPAGASPDLVVHVEPFWYRYHGAYKLWPGGSVDLADYLPSTTDYWHWAIVCVWGYDNSIQVVSSSEVAGRALLTDELLSGLSADMEGLVPTDAVQLQESFTTITHAEYFRYGRLLAAEIGLPSSPINWSSAYGHLPSTRRALWAGPFTNTGTFINEGTLRIL